MANTQKKSLVSGIISSLEKSDHFVLFQHAGLNHKKLEELRKSLLKISSDAKIKVAKNSLLKVALDSWSSSKKLKDESFDTNLKSALSQATALVTISKEWNQVLSALKKAGSEVESVVMKLGFVEGSIFDQSGMNKLASLPSRETLLGKLIGSMKAPSTRTVMSLKYPMTKYVMVLKAKAKQG